MVERPKTKMEDMLASLLNTAGTLQLDCSCDPTLIRHGNLHEFGSKNATCIFTFFIYCRATGNSTLYDTS